MSAAQLLLLSVTEVAPLLVSRDRPDLSTVIECAFVYGESCRQLQTYKREREILQASVVQRERARGSFKSLA